MFDNIQLMQVGLQVYFYCYLIQIEVPVKLDRLQRFHSYLYSLIYST